MAYPKGAPKIAGRQKGTPNKTTTACKEALIEAFEKLGGVTSLVTWGKENQTEFYKLWVKILPQDVNLSSKDGVKFTLAIGNDKND